MLGGTLLMVGIITLGRALFLSSLIEERDDFEIKRRHKVAAVVIGATTGFVIGITSAGSGTVIAILLITVFRLSPRRVVGTDIFHAAILLWAAGIAHIISGNVDFGLAANILLGSLPGVVIGSALSGRAPVGFLRIALGLVLLGLGNRDDPEGRPQRLADRRGGRRRRPRADHRRARTISTAAASVTGRRRTSARRSRRRRPTTAPRSSPPKSSAERRGWAIAIAAARREQPAPS